MINVHLDLTKMMFCQVVAYGRQMTGSHKPGRYGAPTDEWMAYQKHFIGALGECAVAAWLGVHWDGAMGNFKAKDAGQLQVRANSYYNGDLILHHYDLDADIFVSVSTFKTPSMILQGWMTGHEAKQAVTFGDKLKNNRPAFFVPVGLLHPMETCPIQPLKQIAA